MTANLVTPEHNENPISTRKPNYLLWVGPVLTFAGVISYFLYFSQFPDLRDFPWVNFPLVILGVVFSGIAVWRAFSRPNIYRGRILGSIGAMLSLTFASLFCFYIFHLSYQVPAETSVTAGLKEIPDLELSDHEGRLVRLNDLRGKNVVITFYRGHW